MRAGDKSLHPQWIDSKRNFDIAVSYYGNNPERYKDQYDYIHHFKGSKWQGLDDFVKSSESIISNYYYVWFPDDDLFADYKIINSFFEVCSLFDLTIAQPALADYSYISWNITRRKKGLIFRITDFVEIMAPCFKVNCFDKFKNTFSENSSGFGLEWLWKKIAYENNIMKFGIVDVAPIFHTREVGSAGHGGSINLPQLELKNLLAKYNIEATSPKTLQEYKLKSKNE